MKLRRYVACARRWSRIVAYSEQDTKKSDLTAVIGLEEALVMLALRVRWIESLYTPHMARPTQPF